MKKKGEIAIAMTTYNGSRFLKKQIDSILLQQSGITDFFVCDDASTDDTVAILESYKQQGYLRYIVNQERKGVIENFRQAVQGVHDADYVVLADQDDIWLPNKLSVLKAAMENMNDEMPAIVYSDIAVINEEDTIVNQSFWNELGQDHYHHNLDTLMMGNFVTGCSVMMNRSMRDLFIKMPQEVKLHDAWLALIAYSFGQVKEITETLVLYRKHADNVAFTHFLKSRNVLTNLMSEFVKIIKGSDRFLMNELITIELFRDTFKERLSKEHMQKIDHVLRLKHAKYWKKKWYAKSLINRHHK